MEKTLKLTNSNRKLYKIIFTITLILIVNVITSANASNLNLYRGKLSYNITGGYEVPLAYYGTQFNNGPTLGIDLHFLPSTSIMKSFLWWDYYFFESSIRFLSLDLEKNPKSNIQFYSIDMGPILYYPLFRWFYPMIGGSIGGYYSILKLDSLGKSESNSNFLARGKLGFMIPVTSSLSLKMEGAYNYFHMPLDSDRYTSYSVNLSASYSFHGDYGNQLGKNESHIRVVHQELEDLFAIRYLQYNSGGIGTITIKNVSSKDIYNVRIETAIEDITDDSKQSDEIAFMRSGEIKIINLPINISQNIHELNEDKKMTLSCRIIYSSKSSKYYYKETTPIMVHNKNALTWEKTAHLGSFIMPRDDTIATLSRTIMSKFKKLKKKGIPGKLQTAMHIFNVLSEYGIAYASDAVSGYSASSKNKSVVDSVQLPVETLRRKAGDCDDITTLYTSLLQAVGIQTAIITIPGHVFMMFDTEVPARASIEVSHDKNNFFIYNGTVWIPVEVTMMGKSFNDAWKAGVRDVYSNKGSGLEIVETADAWNTFPPADVKSSIDVAFPDSGKVKKRIARDILEMKSNLHDKRIIALKKKLRNKPGNFKAWNSLGVIHGKLNQLHEARNCFKRSVKVNPRFSNGYCNLGNISMIQKKFKSAEKYFRKALSVKSSNTNARINLARVLYELKVYKKAKVEYQKVIKKYPGYSRRYGYLAYDGSSSKTALRAFKPEERILLNAWD